MESAATVSCRLRSDLDLLSLHQAFPARYPHFLESATQGGANARFDILFAFPGETLRLNGDGTVTRGDHPDSGGDFLAALDRWWLAERADIADNPFPFSGGWFLYLGYELVSQIESRVAVRKSSDVIALATRFPAAIIRNHKTGEVWFVCEAAQAEQAKAQVLQDSAGCDETISALAPPVTVTEEPDQIYLDAIASVKDYIRAGDVFQVNLSRNWQIEFSEALNPAAVYRQLRTANPAPFAGIAQLPGFSVISSSPERLVAVRDNIVRTRPIAGTYPRSGDQAQDATFAAELLAHPKERAEHVMLIDLERNDLGRICETGSVNVPELMTLESYRYVHHIVSEVRGTLRPEVTPGQVIAAVFPGGTITGCPKVRCMEIIAELEHDVRGPYTGAMGYLNRNGSLDLNILIRTLKLRDRKVYFRAGGGIVADSVPERELAETRAKARGLLAALQNERAA